MLISGIVMNFKAPIWQFDWSHLTGSTALYLTFGIIAGTAIAFFFFIESLNYLSAKETTLFGTIEPVMAILASALWLNVTFRSFQLIGILLRSEEHTSELQSRFDLVCRLLLEKKKYKNTSI